MAYIAHLRRVVAALGFVLVTLVSSSVMAHLMPAGKGTLNVVGSKVYVVVSLPVLAFRIKTAVMGRIGTRELAESEADLRDQVRQGIGLSSSNGVSATLEQILLSLPSGEGHDGSGDEDLLVMIVARFETPPGSVELTSSLWAEGKGGLRIKGTVSEGSVTLKSETGKLSPKRPSFAFFTPVRKSPFSVRLALLALALLAAATALWHKHHSPKHRGHYPGS